MIKMGLEQSYLDNRASIDYDSHDEMQMKIIIEKIKKEIKRRYGERTELIKDDVLRSLVKG